MTGRDPDGKFAPGNRGGSGNPFAGRVNKIRAQLLEAATPEILTTVIDKLLALAESGNLDAVRLLFDRLLGRIPEAPQEGADAAPLPFAVSGLTTSAGILAMQTQATAALAAGELTTAQAVAIVQTGELLRRTVEQTALEARVRALEELNP